MMLDLIYHEHISAMLLKGLHKPHLRLTILFQGLQELQLLKDEKNDLW